MRLNDEISRDEFTKMKDALENQIVGLRMANNEVKTDELNIEAISRIRTPIFEESSPPVARYECAA